jgi:hypothetical protein
LIKRHNIKGISTFSEFAFVRQMKIPGVIVFRAIHHQTTVGMIIWYVNGEVGYYHLGAFNAAGYKLRASFALFWYAINYFVDIGLKLLNLGGGAGLKNNGTDGLSRFKRGWSTESRTAYYCGRIFNQTRYAEIVQQKGLMPTNYFPAYRQGEFA